ncbi:hypothetical protein BRC69_05630 [Halobacteriales archaeon QH_6_66_25]|nr:MAG: hypothetical protein BRC69_05630 [Halobacteriales archaeon QH_6_66_25]
MSDLGDFTDFDADDGGIEEETEGGGDGAEGEDGIVEAPSGTPDDGTADEFESRAACRSARTRTTPACART